MLGVTNHMPHAGPLARRAALGRLFALAAMFVQAPVTAAQTAQRATQTEATVKLPTAPDAVILRLTSAGGMEASQASNLPLLELWSSGELTARPATPFGPVRRGRLELDTLQQLLDFIVHQQQFGQIDGPAIARRMKYLDDQGTPGRLSRLRDAGSMSLEVNLPDLSHRVETLPPGITASRYPTIAELTRFKAIVDRLLDIAAMAK